jgi:gluconate 5-dehydrogenase
MSTPLTDAVVTGAGRGLGRAVALALAAEGTSVWICSENRSELAATASLIAEAGGQARPIQTDLSDPDACRAFVEMVTRDASQLRAIINNAAVLRLTRLEDLTLSEWSHTIAVNLTAPVLLTRDFLPLLADAGGSVINVSSRAGVIPFEGEAAYCASKYGIEAFTKCLALELGSSPVSVNTITPGIKIKPTSITEEQIPTVPTAERNTWADPIEITPAFLFLARLRGEVSGRRFDALTLTRALERYGRDETLARIDELSE